MVDHLRFTDSLINDSLARFAQESGSSVIARLLPAPDSLARFTQESGVNKNQILIANNSPIIIYLIIFKKHYTLLYFKRSFRVYGLHSKMKWSGYRQDKEA